VRCTAVSAATVLPAAHRQASSIPSYDRHDRHDRWFRRNRKDVLQRQCSAGEKADVLAWLIALKP